MNVIKLKMTNSMQLGGRVFPKGTIIYIDKYNPSGTKSLTYTIYNEHGDPMSRIFEGPIPGGDLLNNSSLVE